MISSNRKLLRKIGRSLDLIFSKNGHAVPVTREDFRDKNSFSRMILLPNHRAILLTERGYSSLSDMVSSIHAEVSFSRDADRGDVWTACWTVVKDCFAQSVRLTDASELISRVAKILEPEICSRRFVVPILGIELKDVEEVSLGSLRVVRPSMSFVDSFGVKHHSDHLSRFIEQTKSILWLTGVIVGTQRVATRRFREKAQLATGLLAIIAASLYEYGAHGFRIGIVMSPEEAYGRATYLSWSEIDSTLVITTQFTRAQLFTVNPETRADIEASPIARRAFAILESNDRTDLEDSIVKAVHWFSDAHRDEIAVMRLLKYWSCIETFFSSSEKKITKSVAIGLAATLVHGGFSFLSLDQYTAFKRKIAVLYGLRSQATHGASYTHVGVKDAADLSQWVSWLIVTAVAFTERGFTSANQLKAWTRRVDGRDSMWRRWFRGFRERVLSTLQWLIRKHVGRP